MSDETTNDDPIGAQLRDFRERYTNRRTVPWQLLDEAERLVAASVEYQRLRYDLSLLTLREEHERTLVQLRDRVESQDQRIQRQAQQLEEKRALAEARRAAQGDQVEVTIRSDGYQDWCVADLEEIAYRLRCGGATDTTHVSMESNRAVALVPVPELVKLDRPQLPTSQTNRGIVETEQRKYEPWKLAALAVAPFAAGALLALLLLVIF